MNEDIAWFRKRLALKWPSAPAYNLKATLNAPLFGDVRAASDAALIMLVLVLELALAVVESEAKRPMAEALSSGVLVSFVVVAVATGVGEGAAAAAPAGFYCVYVCVCVLVFTHLYAYMRIESTTDFQERQSNIKPPTLFILPETLPHLRSVSMETTRLYLKYGYAETDRAEDERLRVCHLE